MVHTGNKVQDYGTRGKDRLWSIAGSNRYSNDHKTGISEFIKYFTKSERDQKSRRLGSGLRGNCEINVVIF